MSSTLSGGLQNTVHLCLLVPTIVGTAKLRCQKPIVRILSILGLVIYVFIIKGVIIIRWRRFPSFFKVTRIMSSLITGGAVIQMPSTIRSWDDTIVNQVFRIDICFTLLSSIDVDIISLGWCQLSFMLIKVFLVLLFSSAKIKCIKEEHHKSHVFFSQFWESKQERKRKSVL